MGPSRATLFLGLLCMSPFWQPLAPSDAEVARRASAGVAELCAAATPAVIQVRARGTDRRWGGTEGSGVILRSDGVFVTNHHVVKDSGRIWAVLDGGRRLPAEVLALDPETDLAVLKITAEGETFATLPLAASGPRVGEGVLVLGNPFGIGTSVTQGIVSGLGRSDLNLATYEDYIQTDAAINPGNSGGPMINLRGEVVGVAAAQGLEREGDLGIGFAIPAAIVRHVVEEVLDHGEVLRGWLGVDTEARFDPERLAGYEGVSRVRISRFMTDSPARDAGLLIGDILIAVGKRRLLDRKDLMTAVAILDPGSTVELEIWRKGKILSLPVIVGRRPAPEEG